MTAPRALILNAPGINCNLETAHAFEMAGALTEQVHISQLIARERKLSDYDILALSGGFSYGDDIASGRVLGLELRKRLGDELNTFVEAGRLTVGICNGFQALIESGLLPDGKIDDAKPKAAAMVHNENGKFEDRWEYLEVGRSVCRFAHACDLGDIIRLPVAHGEGRFLRKDRYDYQALLAAGQVVFRYSDEWGAPTMEYPANPNGSPYGIAGICDPTGRILGMMPHPERNVIAEQHPNWRREQVIPYGRWLFTKMVAVAKEI